MRTRERFIWAALIAAWMGVIFWFSAQSGENSAALSGGIVEWAAHLIRPGLDQMPQTERQAFLDSLRENPLQGVVIAPHVRKVRMAISDKGRGKSGGARVITFDALVSDQDGKLYLLLIYDKADTSNVKMNVVREIIKEMGL